MFKLLRQDENWSRDAENEISMKLLQVVSIYDLCYT